MEDLVDADIEAVFARFVRPVLVEHGYTPNEHTYRRRVEFGVYAIFDFGVRPWVPGQRLLWASFGVVLHKPRPWLPQDLQAQVARDPGIEKAQFRGQLRPPEGYALEVPAPGWTLLSGVSVEPLGPALVDGVEGVAMPLISQVLDGERRMAVLTHPDAHTHGLPPFIYDTSGGEPIYQNW
ncbi:MAG TPA: hypothetical protein VE441_02810 [Mycobacterium sp.]|nr:hypothetical protein [Mycobacterium sp.]